MVSSGSGLLAATPSYDFPAENAPPLPPVAADHKVLRVGTRTGYHNEFLLAGAESEQRSALTELVEGLADHAAGLGRDALLFDFLTTDSLRLLAGLFPVRAQLRSAEAVVHNEEVPSSRTGGCSDGTSASATTRYASSTGPGCGWRRRPCRRAWTNSPH